MQDIPKSFVLTLLGEGLTMISARFAESNDISPALPCSWTGAHIQCSTSVSGDSATLEKISTVTAGEVSSCEICCRHWVDPFAVEDFLRKSEDC